LITQNTAGIQGDANKGAGFGQALTTAISTTRFADISLAPELLQSRQRHVIYGLSPVCLRQTIKSGSRPITAQRTSAVVNLFGSSLAVGDFNGDFVPDLAIARRPLKWVRQPVPEQSAYLCSIASRD